MTHTPHEAAELAEADVRVRADSWGGCIAGDGWPAVYMVVTDEDGKKIMIVCRTTLADIKETYDTLRSSMT